MMVEIRYLKGGNLSEKLQVKGKILLRIRAVRTSMRPKPLPEDGTCNSSHLWHKSWSCVRHRACSRRTQSYLRLQGVHA